MEDGGETLETVFLKLKNILIDNAKIFLFVFFLMMIFSGLWMHEEYAGASYEEKNVTSYTQRGNYTYSASVTEPNPLYPEGTKLEMGNPAYFLSVSPTEDISFVYSIEAADSADLIMEAKTMIVASGKEGAGEEQKIFWQKNFQVGDSKTAKMSSGDALTSNFTLDVPKTQLMVKEVQDQLNYSSDPTIEIVTAIKYEGKINGENVKGVKNFVIPVDISSTYYQMPEKLGFIEDTYKNVKVKKAPSLSTIKFPLFLFLLSTVLTGILIPIRKMSTVDPAYIEKLEKESKRLPFKEFISKGKLPENRLFPLQVDISSLQDLVDAAVDMNERVIHDVGSGEYFIIHNGALYIFFDAPSE
ncbi:DUF5305 family protein [Methanosarcina sp. Z-7115]|uniref:DUF5305 family protein n=1 Tax=Methanosarcina baikalica TaxID=3073890 RepID=A0ABU2D3M6_9EURY|nr:DUF5305 family protein [Methanosarcina sp. Z-7115]MDR7666569.1 DUF5305 family protein [Methanosarcina sp. Z-7115]